MLLEVFATPGLRVVLFPSLKVVQAYTPNIHAVVILIRGRCGSGEERGDHTFTCVVAIKYSLLLPHTHRADVTLRRKLFRMERTPV